MERSRTYAFGASRLTVVFGDITKSHAQVLVSSDDYLLSMGGGVSRALLIAGGNAIALDAAKKVPASLGDVVVTTAGSLPAQYVFHAVTIGPNMAAITAHEVVRRTALQCMSLLRALRLNSIAFPALGAGAAGFSYSDVAKTMAEVIASDLKNNKVPVEVTIHLYDRFNTMQPIDFAVFFEEISIRAQSAEIRTSSNGIGDVPRSPELDLARATPEEIKGHLIQGVRKLLALLDDQRIKLEERLIRQLGEESQDVDRGLLDRKLAENQQLRFQYFRELQALMDGQPSDLLVRQPRREAPEVFVSSTSADLKEHREAVRKEINRRKMIFVGMELFGADTVAPAAKIVRAVEDTDVYVGIFGSRYGSIDAATGLSMTELEFNAAEASQKPMFLYVASRDAVVKMEHIETSPGGLEKLQRLKRRILDRYTVYQFRDAESLAKQVFVDLGNVNSDTRAAATYR